MTMKKNRISGYAKLEWCRLSTTMEPKFREDILLAAAFRSTFGAKYTIEELDVWLTSKLNLEYAFELQIINPRPSST